MGKWGCGGCVIELGVGVLAFGRCGHRRGAIVGKWEHRVLEFLVN